MENTVDVYGVVYDLRMHRPLMVQTEVRLSFIQQHVFQMCVIIQEGWTQDVAQNYRKIRYLRSNLKLPLFNFPPSCLISSHNSSCSQGP